MCNQDIFLKAAYHNNNNFEKCEVWKETQFQELSKDLLKALYDAGKFS